MLILGRKPGQKISVDGPCRIHVMKAKNGKVSLGIEAPEHVNIIRGELEEPTDLNIPVPTTEEIFANDDAA